MERLRHLALIGLVPLLASGACDPEAPAAQEAPDPGPWTHLQFLDGPDVFHFAVVGDRAGWHRPGVFREALDRLEALGPAFVLSVGDLVDTGDFGEDPDRFTPEALEHRYDEFGRMVGRLAMPFFYVGGNNEFRTEEMAEAWSRRLGPRYYHFRYRDALFVVLNSEDPPGEPTGSIGEEQLTWLRGVLAGNQDVRWTFLFVHRPMWRMEADPDWTAVEEALGDRPRTAFGGHAHRYRRTEMGDHVHYGLATTGGGSELSGVSAGQFDHVVWVTMTGQGPRISNLMLDGIWGDDPTQEVER